MHNTPAAISATQRRTLRTLPNLRMVSLPQVVVASLLVTAIAAEPVKLILDTDMGGGPCKDVDDVGTLCMLNALAEQGEVELLAIMLNTLPPACAGAISVIQHWYGRDYVPIGVLAPDARTDIHAHEYVYHLLKHWSSPVKSAAGLPRAVDLYRRVLGAARDGSVAIASVGVLTNLAQLLRSQPDQHSSLTGEELLRRKVHTLTIMGGRYPFGRRVAI